MNESRHPTKLTPAQAANGTGEERLSTAHVKAASLQRRRQGRLLIARAAKKQAFADLMPATGLQPGDSLHLISRGHFDTATIPEWFAINVERIERLTISSLTISKQAVEVMERLDQAGKIGQARIMVQDLTMRRSDNRANVEAIRRWMLNPVHTLKVAESHAKVIVMEFATQPTVVIESSANLSSNDSRLEQYAIHVDTELAAFHLSWMEEVFGYNKQALPRHWFPSPLATRTAKD